jgi:tRNA U34 5-carboxymethylaminomethyl modifying GTPase MnmE/TrmE
MSNIPLGILQKVNAVERLGVTGEYKKEAVVNDILSIIDDNVDIQQIIEDLVELLIDISKKKLKLIVNKKSCIPI